MVGSIGEGANGEHRALASAKVEERAGGLGADRHRLDRGRAEGRLTRDALGEQRRIGEIRFENILDKGWTDAPTIRGVSGGEDPHRPFVESADPRRELMVSCRIESESDTH